MISFLGMTTLTLAILIVIGVIVLAIIGVLFWTKIVEHKERRAFLRLRKKKIEINVSGADLTRTMLDQLGLVNVEIERSSFISSFFRGNRYSAKNKKIYLSKNVYNNSANLGLATVTRVVGLAKLDAEGNKGVKRVSNVGWLQSSIGIIVPAVFVSILVDALVFSELGVISIVACCVAVFAFIVILALALSTAKVIKEADNEGLNILEAMMILSDEEFKIVKKMSKLNYKIFVANIILTSLFILKFSAQLLWSILKFIGRKR